MPRFELPELSSNNYIMWKRLDVKESPLCWSRIIPHEDLDKLSPLVSGTTVEGCSISNSSEFEAFGWLG